MRFFYGKLYGKYFPINSVSAFYEMDEKEIGTLARWIKNIESDVTSWNMESRMRAVKQGGYLCRQIALTYPKSINDLCSLLENRQFFSLDGEDLEFVNDILHRHKYNSFISCFVFPASRKVSLDKLEANDL